LALQQRLDAAPMVSSEAPPDGSAGATRVGQPLGAVRVVAPIGAIALELARNRGFVHPEYFSHVFVPGSESEQHEHLVSFLAGELCVGVHRFSFYLPVKGAPILSQLAHLSKVALRTSV
jgi:hypothetical protein